MPNLKTHCAISLKRTGFDFKELHQWIDAPLKELGYNHRTKRHSYNEKEEKFIEEYWNKKKGEGWGKKAVVEWLFHIALDHLQTAFKKSYDAYGEKVFNYIAFGLSRTNFVHIDHDAYTEYGLQDYFDSLKRPLIVNIFYDILNFFRRRKKYV